MPDSLFKIFSSEVLKPPNMNTYRQHSQVWHVLCCVAMRVREPSSLRLVREFPDASLSLSSEQFPYNFIVGQNMHSSGTLVLADLINRRVTSLDVQRGALQLLFKERDEGWCVSNARLLESQLANVLVVTECQQSPGDQIRVVMAKKKMSTNGIYITDHAVLLDETSSVCNHTLFFEK